MSAVWLYNLSIAYRIVLFFCAMALLVRYSALIHVPTGTHLEGAFHKGARVHLSPAEFHSNPGNYKSANLALSFGRAGSWSLCARAINAAGESKKRF